MLNFACSVATMQSPWLRPVEFKMPGSDTQGAKVKSGPLAKAIHTTESAAHKEAAEKADLQSGSREGWRTWVAFRQSAAALAELIAHSLTLQHCLLVCL